MPFAGFKDFGSCVAAQRRKGKTPESAKKICGALQARTEGKAAANASQVPADVQPHFNRSEKTLDFLRQQGVLADNDDDYNDDSISLEYNDDTSLDNQTPIQSTQQLSNSIYSDPESYSDKVTRIMDEYRISEDEAKLIVGRIIQDEMTELDRREYELIKQTQIEKAQADNLMTSEDAQQPEPEQQQQEQEQEIVQEDVNNNNNSGDNNTE